MRYASNTAKISVVGEVEGFVRRIRVVTRDARRKTPNAKTGGNEDMLALDKDTFEQVLQAEGLVLVDYWSESCVPCKRMPDVEVLSQQFEGKVKFCKLDVTAADAWRSHKRFWAFHHRPLQRRRESSGSDQGQRH